MKKEENINLLEERLENLREKLNKNVVKYMEDTSKEEYIDIVNLSRELDDFIVNYINSRVHTAKS